MVNNVANCNTKYNSDYSSSGDNCAAITTNESTDKIEVAKHENHNRQKPGNTIARLRDFLFDSHKISGIIEHL